MPWAEDEFTSCARRIKRGGWAEDLARTSCTGPIGPRNTWSNAAYLFAGLWLAWAHREPASQVVGFALCVLALGSGAYHWFKTLAANRLDHTGMYLVFGALSAFAVVGDHPAAAAIMLVTGLLLAVLFAYVIPGINLDVQMGLLFWFCAIRGTTHGDALLTMQAVGVFVAAFGVWHLDKKQSPVVGLWGHALWHVFTALAIPALYLGVRG